MTNALTVRPSTPASEYSYERYWCDDFSNGLELWNRDTLEDDSLHRVGNSFLNTDGTVAPEKWRQPKGVRWSAAYNRERDKTEYIDNGNLVQAMHVIKEKNLYRKNYEVIRYKDEMGNEQTISVAEDEEAPELIPDNILDVKIMPYGDHVLCASWLSTALRKWDNHHERHITDFDSVLSVHGPGTYINMRACYENMLVREARHSIWSMPLYGWGDENTPEKPAKLLMGDDFPYNDKTEDGCENDVIEVVRNTHKNFYIASQKLVAGSAGDTPNGSVNHENDRWKEYGIDLFTGFHDIGCLWHADGHHDWFIDGHHTNQDMRKVWTANYLCLTTEYNSGCKKPREDKVVRYPAGGPYRPTDAGLMGDSCILDMDRMGEHKTIIDSVSLFHVTDKKTQVQGSDIERAVAMDLGEPEEKEKVESALSNGVKCPVCDTELILTAK